MGEVAPSCRVTLENRRGVECVGEILVGGNRDDDDSLLGVEVGKLPARKEPLADRFDFISKAPGVNAWDGLGLGGRDNEC